MPRHYKANRKLVRYEHDDRGDDFRPSHRKGFDKKKNMKFAADALMKEYSNNTISNSGETWIRITVVYGSQLDKEWLCQSILNSLGVVTKIFNYFIELQNAIMFLKMRCRKLNEFKESLKSLVEPTSGRPVSCDIVQVPEPGLPAPRKGENGDTEHPFPDTWLQALKTCFHARFNTVNKSLDLSNLQNDPDLQSVGLYLPMNKATISKAFISILIENNANIDFLNLSNSRLSNVQFFNKLLNTGVRISKIDLSVNPIASIASLTGLRSIEGLNAIDISETPLNLNKDDNKKLINQIRSLLPGIKNLNGRPLPDSVQVPRADMEDRYSGPVKPLPNLIQGYFPSEDIRMAILLFLKQYYEKFDSANRGDALLPYYLPESLFSMSAVNNVASIQTANNYAAISLKVEEGKKEMTKRIIYTTQKFDFSYLDNSRNISRMKNTVSKEKHLFRGALQIANMLKSLPNTEHLLETFAVDITNCTTSIMMINISGIYYEIYESAKETRRVPRSFTRTMIITAPGETIAQDILNVSNPNDEICRRYIKEMRNYHAEKIKVEQKPANTSNLSSSAATINNEILNSAATFQGSTFETDPMRESMVLELKSRSGMNDAFTRQCLAESNWDLNLAWSRFDAMNKTGQVPQNAFV